MWRITGATLVVVLLLAQAAATAIAVGSVTTSSSGSRADGFIAAPPAIAIAGVNKNIHVVFANHLDVGFTGLDNETLNAYFHQHIPRALWLADWLAAADPPVKFVWTSHPWLLSLFLSCPSHIGVTCPSPGQQARVRAAMAAGVISWHAAPFNLQWELLSGQQAVAAALAVGAELDRQAGLPPKTVVSLRDVPGLSRAAIPLLVGHGIKALTVGVNAGSAPPDVPVDRPFIWRDPLSGASLVAFWHAGGYGGSCPDPTAPPGAPELPVACRGQCLELEGLEDVLCLSWRADNQGPPQDALEVSAILDLVAAQWGGQRGNNTHTGANSSPRQQLEAAVVAVSPSSLQAYVDVLVAAVEAGRVTLPVVTGEIGDTWVYGVASDPLKVAAFRAAARARLACEGNPACDDQAPQVSRFDRLLLKVPEHTWGLDVKTTLARFNCCGTYANDHLARCTQRIRPLAQPQPQQPQQQPQGQHQRQQQAFLRTAERPPTGGAGATTSRGAAAAASGPADPPGCEGTTRLVASWQRQAAYVDWALQELPCGHPILQHYAADVAARVQLAALALQPLAAAHSEGEQEQEENGGAVADADATMATTAAAASSNRTGSSRGFEGVAAAAGAAASDTVPQDGAISSGASSPTTGSTAHSTRSDTSTSGQAKEQGGGEMVFRTSFWIIGVTPGKDGGITTLCRVPFGSAGGGSSSPPGPSSGPANNQTPKAAAAGDPCVGSHNWAATAAAAGPRHASTTTTSTTSSTSSTSTSGSTASGAVDAEASNTRRRGRPPFARPLYVAFNEADYEPLWREYAWEGPPHTNPWFRMDLGKPGLNETWDSHLDVQATLQRVDHTTGPDGALTLQLCYPLPRVGGAPRTLVLLLQAGPDSERLALSLVWGGKRPSRIPEALWLQFGLVGGLAVQASSWRLHKMGSPIDPQQVMRNGSFSLHAVDDVTGVSVLAPFITSLPGAPPTRPQQQQQQQQEPLRLRSLSIIPLDSPLVSPGKPQVLPNVRHPPDTGSHGVSFLLHNNLWGTNYVAWLPYQSAGAEQPSSGGPYQWLQACACNSEQAATPAAAAPRPGRQEQAWWQRGLPPGQWVQWLLRRLHGWPTAASKHVRAAAPPPHTPKHSSQAGKPHPSSSTSSTADSGPSPHRSTCAPLPPDAGLMAAVSDQRVAVFRFLVQEVDAEEAGQEAVQRRA